MKNDQKCAKCKKKKVMCNFYGLLVCHDCFDTYEKMFVRSITVQIELSSLKDAIQATFDEDGFLSIITLPLVLCYWSLAKIGIVRL